MNRILRRTLKFLGWTVVSVVALLLLIVVLVQVPGVQNFLKGKAVAYLQKKIGTKVEISHLSIAFPKKIVLEGIYFEDQKKDTLLAGDRLAVDISMLRLLHKQVEVNDLELSGIRANIYRKGSDTVFNYDYILKAFATGDTSTKPKDTTGAFTINVKHIKLHKILATFRDDQSGTDTYAWIGDFETHIKKFDLDKMVFDVPDVALNGFIARAYQHKPLAIPKSTAQVKAEASMPINIALSVGDISLKSIDAVYGNDVSAFNASVKLSELSATLESIDLPKLIINLKNLRLIDADAVITMGATQQSAIVADQVEKTAQAQVENPWKLILQHVDFRNTNLKFDNNNSARVKGAMDYAHLDVQRLNLAAHGLAFTPTLFTGDVDSMALAEKNCNFLLKSLHTGFVYDDYGVALKNLYLETDHTILRDSISVGWPMGLLNLPKQPGNMILRADLNNCRVAFKDVLLFAPMLATLPPFAGNSGVVMNLDGEMSGYLKDLYLPHVTASGFGNTAVRLSGRIRGLPDPIRTVYDLNIAYLRTTSGDLYRLAPKGTIPNTIRIPEAIALKGSFDGGMQAFTTALDISTSRGGATVRGSMRDMGAGYNLTATTSGLDVGWITKQEKTIGKVSAMLTATGSGFDPATMVANVKGRVLAANAMGYNYRNLDFNAKLNRGNVQATAKMRDPNLSFDLDATALMKGEYPAIKAALNLDSVNLKALGLYSGDLRLHGIVNADLTSTNPDALVGNISIANLIMLNDGKRYAASDTITINATADGANRRLVINSEAVTADLNGQYKLTQIAPAVQSVINQYYKVAGFKPAHFTPQEWTLDAAIKPSPLLYAFVPDMKGSDTIHAIVGFNSAANDLHLTANAPKILYAGNAVDSLTVRANTATALDYSVTMNSAGNQSFKLNRTELKGAVANNTVSANLDVKDPKGVSRYGLSALLNQTPNDGFSVSLQQGMMLNYAAWAVAPDNYIKYDNSGLVINNFNISNGGQSIYANSTSPMAAAPIDVRFTDFRINTITQIAEQDSLLVDGLINGTAQIRNATTSPIFTSDLAVAGLSYKRDTVGNLSIKVNNETANTLAANIGLQGNGNDIRLDGRYFISSKSVDMNLNLANVNLATLKPFTAGQLQDASGALRGSMAVKGTLDKPAVNGSLRFDSAYITPTIAGERFGLANDEIAVNGTGIHFHGFELRDSASNVAAVNGDILTSDFKNYGFALDINAKDFEAINAPKRRGKEQQMFYGRMNLTTNTKIRGDMNLPVVTTSVRINKNTDFSYILPANDPEVQSRIGVVEFVDMSQPEASRIFAGSVAQDSVTKVARKGIDASAHIETDSAAKFAIVIDERNGDALHLRGTASLEAGMDKSGKVSLTGTYTMQEGSYLLTLNFLKRQFNMQAGSTITWDGDPMSAQVDITALYLANTAPIDLMEHQLSGSSQSELNTYKQKLPFSVLLKMKGELMKPQISFDITLPDREQSRWKDVEAKLEQIRADESELNKQVFALLLLNRFVDENPLASNGTGFTGEAFVRQSASRILTDQLNRLAGNLIKGVDLSFGVNSGDDYSSGELSQRTDVTVGVSKRLMNDRLRVNVGSSFQVEGPTTNNQSANNIAGDVSLDYQLSKDGRYLVRAYRRNNYEGVVEGQVVETGATFIFTLEYDKLREFFRRPKKTETSSSN